MPYLAPLDRMRPASAYLFHACPSVIFLISFLSTSDGMGQPSCPFQGSFQPYVASPPKEGTASSSIPCSFNGTYACGNQESAQMSTPRRPAGVSMEGSSFAEAWERKDSSIEVGNTFKIGFGYGLP